MSHVAGQSTARYTLCNFLKDLGNGNLKSEIKKFSVSFSEKKYSANYIP
jgi:hypothetical protein